MLWVKNYETSHRHSMLQRRGNPPLVVMTTKTSKTHMPQLIKTVTEHHSYECPCILVLPIEGGNTEFLRWIETETDLT